LGILALQNNFVSRTQLLAAFNAWVADKTKPLAALLRGPAEGVRPMPRAKPKQTVRPVTRNGPTPDVLTLSDAAAYLRLREADVLRLVEEQDLPARRLGNEWRFLKAAIQVWLGRPITSGQNRGIWAAAGALSDDPYLKDMLNEIERMRGRR
jgi:excisionase family DNA binding protein